MKLNNEDFTNIINILQKRFEDNLNRHKDIKWNDVYEKLIKYPEKVWSLNEMEKTGGKPDVVPYDLKNMEYVFYDCSKETPSERRNICYDQEALKSRKQFKPHTTALDMANEMGIEILNEEEYRYLQTLGKFDLKTSSWLKTPIEIRKLGGAIFGDRRYNNVFVYHNGAESYYGVRGFRGSLKI